MTDKNIVTPKNEQALKFSFRAVADELSSYDVEVEHQASVPK